VSGRAVSKWQENPVTDLELAHRCAQGDRESQRLLYDRHCDRVYRILYRMSGNADNALDLAQEAFIRVFEKIHTFDGGSTLMTWIYRIAVNEALQSRRRENRTAKALGLLAENQANRPSASADDRGGEALNALTLLPEAERKLLVLRYIEELTYDEMARVLEKPPGTIASGLNRARQMLRRILTADDVKKPDAAGIKQDRQSAHMVRPQMPLAPGEPRVSTGGNEP
jgi:RNA polymerase sigma-70 factor, ECF subfamily